MTDDNTYKSILLVEPDGIVRTALQLLIDSFGDYRVVATAADTEGALSKLDQYLPFFLILEIELPGKSGIELLLELRRRESAAKPLVLTRRTDKKSVELAVSSGALAYVSKNSAVSDLKQALAMAAQNRPFLCSTVQTLCGALKSTPGTPENDPISCLSLRERQVFFLLASGEQNSTIAKQLFISPRTVETHRARIVRKLGIQSNSDLIRFAIRHGLSTV